MINEINDQINYKQLNMEPEYSQSITLKQRALMMLQSEEYQHKMKLIKEGNLEITKYEFIVYDKKIELPYQGEKVI